MGADEYGFGTVAMIATGCVMARICHTNNCPVGVASQREELRALFPSRPWLDVRSKADLPLDPSIDPSDVPPGTLEVSVLEDQGVEELQELGLGKHQSRTLARLGKVAFATTAASTVRGLAGAPPRLASMNFSLCTCPD